MGNLGLRYRPNNAADLEAHGERLRLLVLDLIDVPPALLERAASHWARTERFMPRADELIALSRKIDQQDHTGSEQARAQLQDHCDRLNAMRWCRNQWSVAKMGDRLGVHRNISVPA